MRLLVRTEIGLVVAVGVGLLVTYVGLAVLLSGRHAFMGALVLVLGVCWTFYAPIAHDRVHLERDEPAHRLWAGRRRRQPPR